METQQSGVKLPNSPESYWLDSEPLPTFKPLAENIRADVVIVGGGITGLTTAYLLIEEGLQVVLLEAGRLLNGTTGHTTAKLTAQHGLFYHELMAHMGRTKARMYYESNMKALEWLTETVKKLDISADLVKEDACIYAVTPEYANKLELEFAAYQSLGIQSELIDHIPFDIKIQNALYMKNQAQFHPVRYLKRIVQQLSERGCRIFEQTTAVDIEYGDEPVVITADGGRVQARKVIACSHFPFYDKLGFYFARLHAERSYVVAGRSDKPVPSGMYRSAESPVRSIRWVDIDNERVVLISGEGHKTGQGKDTLTHYQALEVFGQEVLGLKEALYRWSAQDLYTLDKVPYIGHHTAGMPNVLVATGYKKWGMTTGTLAGLILRDLVLDRTNPYADLYSPQRFYADPSLKTFLSQNLNVAAHLIRGKFELPLRTADQLKPGEGGVVSHGGQRAGAYRDDEGRTYIVDTTCTHMGCEVSWNHGERTWDCPCHGSRFNYRGDVVEGPAKKPLKRLDSE